MPDIAGSIEKLPFLSGKRILQIKKKNLLNNSGFLFLIEIMPRFYKIKKPLEIERLFF